jgi:aminoglycoside/choline kinase family phosphotransferase
MNRPARKSVKPAVDKAQAKRFIEAAREAGASEDEAAFHENLKRLAKPKPEPKSKDC